VSPSRIFDSHTFFVKKAGNLSETAQLRRCDSLPPSPPPAGRPAAAAATAHKRGAREFRRADHHPGLNYGIRESFFTSGDRELCSFALEKLANELPGAADKSG
jgi:hypothetical protein